MREQECEPVTRIFSACRREALIHFETSCSAPRGNLFRGGVSGADSPVVSFAATESRKAQIRGRSYQVFNAVSAFSVFGEGVETLVALHNLNPVVCRAGDFAPIEGEVGAVLEAVRARRRDRDFSQRRVRGFEPTHRTPAGALSGADVSGDDAPVIGLASSESRKAQTCRRSYHVFNAISAVFAFFIGRVEIIFALRDLNAIHSRAGDFFP